MQVAELFALLAGARSRPAGTSYKINMGRSASAPAAAGLHALCGATALMGLCATARSVATATVTATVAGAAFAGDLADAETTVLSYEGSSSFLRLLPWSVPFSFGQLGYATYSDTAPGLPLFPQALALDLPSTSPAAVATADPAERGHGGGQSDLPTSPAAAATADPTGHGGGLKSSACAAPADYHIRYEWRPDFATSSGACGGISVSHRVGYHGNASICARFMITSTSSSPRNVTFLALRR
eukprot:SAG22_NODE_755_length_7442_cov_2.270598_1_plen_242_part_00